MTFNQLHTDTNCNCLDNNNLKQDSQGVYCRRIKEKQIQLSDFQSWWEQGKRPPQSKLKDCQEVCKYKGVSINYLANLEPPQVIINPKHNRLETQYFCILQFKKNAGLLHSTPSKNAPQHHTFYKSDTFSLNTITILQINPIT